MVRSLAPNLKAEAWHRKAKRLRNGVRSGKGSDFFRAQSSVSESGLVC